LAVGSIPTLYHKEHAAILIMSSAAAQAAMAIEVIAVQRLWYTTTPNAAVCIFLIFSSQCLGYGVAGILRRILVYPTKACYHHLTVFHISGTTVLIRYNQFFYPPNLPIMSLLETLHRKKSDTKPQLKIFYWAFCLIFVWEVMPEYIMPILTAINVFCLAKRNSSEFAS
jgi:hypothetical protein